MRLNKEDYNKSVGMLKRYNYNCIKILNLRADIMSISAASIDGMPKAPYKISDTVTMDFEYEGKRWLIELWKGQYGMTTGAEIGVYKTKKPEDFQPGDERKLHYESVTDEELLPIQYVLYRNEEEIIRRKARHWWVTAFEPGLYSKPEDLGMCIKIVFPTEQMCYAFYKGLLDCGYKTREAYFGGNYITMYYQKPKSRQPKRKNRLFRWLAEKNNKRNCRLYNKRTQMFEMDLDKITFLKYRYPLLYHALFGFTGWRKIRGRRKV